MLVLSRKQSERIRVGQDIVVTVVRVAGDKVRLGIEAPPDVVVLRDELRPFAPLSTDGRISASSGSISASSGSISASAAGSISAGAAGIPVESAVNSN